MTSVYSPERFVCEYLVARGALEDRSQFGIVELLVDPSSEPDLGSEHLVLAHDYEAHLETPGSQLVTHGSPVLESLVRAAVERHTCHRRYVAPADKPVGQLEKKAGRILGVEPERVMVASIKRYYAPVLRYRLKQSLVAEQRQEELLTVFVDGYSGTIADKYESSRPLFFSSTAERLLPELPSLPAAGLFARVIEHVSAAVEEGVRRHRDYSSGRLSSDLEQTENYFATMTEEWRMKEAKARFSRDEALLLQCRARLENIEQQKQHHFQDVRSRYAVRCELALLDVVLYMIPRQRIVVETRRGRANHSPAVLWYDEALKELAMPSQ
mgnify:CR=1 FL=1